MRRARRQTRARPCCGNSGTATSASGRPPRRAADGRRGDAVRDEQRLRRVDHTPDVLFPFLTAFHGLHLPAQSCLQYAMFSRRLQPQMCRVETFVPCTARRSVVCSRQTERFLPAGADVLAPTEVGVFFLTDFTGHKKGPISFEAGLAPSSSPATLYPFPCRIFRTAAINLF